MRIRSRNLGLVLALTAAAVVTLGMSAAFLLAKHREAPLELGCFTLFLGVFVLAGLALLVLAVREALSLLVHGTWELEVPEAGGIVGQRLRMRLHPPRRTTPAGPLEARLRCLQSTNRIGGHLHRPDPSSEVRTLVETPASKVTSGPIDPGTGCELTIDVPPDLPGSTSVDHRGVVIVWQVVVDVPKDGIGLQLAFDVPMVREDLPAPTPVDG